jgi:murein DD-endopeptidase MepM/ murein hydrolase activator NlpD
MNYLDVPVVNKFQSKTPKGFYDVVKGHSGVDKMMAIGFKISMPFELTCVSIKTQTEMGLTVYLKDKNDCIHVFAHNSAINVKEGQIVPKDTVFALSGNSGGRTTGAHSHWEVIGKDPYPGAGMMTRTLGEFKGYNLPPEEYVKDRLMAKDALHWSDEHFAWAISKGLITKKYPHDQMVDWGSFVTVLHKLFNLK